MSRAYLGAVLLGRAKVGAALLGAAAVAGDSESRPEQLPEQDYDEIARQRAGFMSYSGIILSGVGLIIILYSGAAITFIDPCL